MTRKNRRAFHGWFTRGFSTIDLKKAKALVAGLS